jgi:hypothetical protein
VESTQNPCGIIHAEFAWMLTCKLDMQSMQTSTESTRTNTESVQTNTESVCTFAGNVGICTESTESVRNTWGSVKYCLRQPVHRPHDHCRLLRTSLIYTRQHMGETFPRHCTSNQRLTLRFRRFRYRHLNRCSSSHWILPLKMPNCHLPPSSTCSLSPARKTTI